MSGCKTYQSMVKKLLSDEINETDKSELYRHAESCRHCRAVIKTYDHLKAQLSPVPHPNEARFRTMRQNVLQAIRAKQTGAVKTRSSFRFNAFFQWLRQPAVAYAFALLLLISGWFLGRETSPANSEPSVFAPLTSGIKQTAFRPTMEKASYLFENVRVRPAAHNRVKLSFNVSTHLEMVREKDDPLVKEVIAQSILNARLNGSQIKSLDYAKDFMDPKIKAALIKTMQHDDYMAVRLKAMEQLMAYPADPQIQEAMLQVLKNEPSTYMRLLAIDYLAKNEVEPSLLKPQLEALNEGRNAPVLMKARQYLHSRKSTP